MSEYVKKEDVIALFEKYHPYMATEVLEFQEELYDMPSADVVEVGVITCLGIKFVVEDDIIKVKWRHGDKHYLVPFGGLLGLWEKYKEQEHE